MMIFRVLPCLYKWLLHNTRICMVASQVGSLKGTPGTMMASYCLCAFKARLVNVSADGRKKIQELKVAAIKRDKNMVLVLYTMQIGFSLILLQLLPNKVN